MLPVEHRSDSSNVFKNKRECQPLIKFHNSHMKILTDKGRLPICEEA